MHELIMIGGGIVLLVAGAELLVRGASAMALRFGVSSLVVGLTIVAFGTSSPELLVSSKAALTGSGEIALGAVVGSNICNVLLILGVAALIRPVSIHLNVIKLDLPIMIAVTVAVSAMIYWGGLGRLEGIVLIAGIIAYTVFRVLFAHREPECNDPDMAEEISESPRSLALQLAFIIAGPLLLSLGADFMLKGSISMAQRLGISQAVIGLTVVAVGASLPELAIAVVAALKNKGDMVVGNIVGSNIFNILGILGIASTLSPIPFSGILPADLAVMIVVAIIAMPLMRSGFALNRWEAVLMLSLYAVYIFFRV